ncbi:MAG: PilZ domain-containing protein [Planctomycetia bacterium]
MSAERRKHRRVHASLPCLMRGPDRRHEPFDLLDLSESGLRMRCARPLAPMTQVEVDIELPAARIGRDKDVLLRLRGVVVWSRRSPAPAGAQTVPVQAWDTGVFFPELTRDQVALLLLFVASEVA